jgi:hypothetical protein
VTDPGVGYQFAPRGLRAPSMTPGVSAR